MTTRMELALGRLLLTDLYTQEAGGKRQTIWVYTGKALWFLATPKMAVGN